MNFLKRIKPETPLRLGLGFMYLFSAYDIWAHPTAWYWAIRPLPQFLQFFIYSQIGVDMYLKLQAVGELLLALLFLLWFLPSRAMQFASAFAALEIFLILLFVGINAVTFRDIGLFGAALALLIILSNFDRVSPR